MGLAEKVLTYCRNNDLIRGGEKVILAVSGGPDSVALLHIACALTGVFPMECAVLHLEHGLRGRDSATDQTFVEGLARKLGLPFFTKSADVRSQRLKGESLEEAARRVRLDYYREVLDASGFDKVATGHTADDNVETIVFRLLTGTGPGGFSGILPRCGSLVHPLLCATRSEILRFLEARSLDYRVDKSNLDGSIARNRIRRQVLPLFEEMNARYREHVLNLAGVVHEDELFLAAIARDTLREVLVESSPRRVKIDYAKLSREAAPVRRRVIIEAARALSGEDDTSKKAYFTFREVQSLLSVELEGNRLLFSTGRLRGGLRVLKEYGFLVFEKRVVAGAGRGYLYTLESLREPLAIEEIGKKVLFEIREKVSSYDSNRMYLDFEKLTLPIKIRTRLKGDRIRFKDLGVKKLKKILIDDKVPLDIREKVPIIVQDDEPVGIFRSYYGAANRVAADYMVSDSTRAVLVCTLV
jgi:tRNA(Ile)-lysidine synthase